MRWGWIDPEDRSEALPHELVLSDTKWPAAYDWLQERNDTIDWGYNYTDSRTFNSSMRLLLADPDVALELKLRFG